MKIAMLLREGRGTLYARIFVNLDKDDDDDDDNVAYGVEIRLRGHGYRGEPKKQNACGEMPRRFMQNYNSLPFRFFFS